MKKILLTMALCILLTGCGQTEDTRVEELQSLYGGISTYSTEAEITIVRETENIDYTVCYEKDTDSIRVTALAPESVRGATAIISGENLRLEYNGTVLDAGILSGKFSAVNCVPVLLQMFPKSYISAWGDAQLDGVSVLRVCFETEWNDETVSCICYFDIENKPVYAEFLQSGKIIAAVGFTNFVFDDILSENG